MNSLKLLFIFLCFKSLESAKLSLHVDPNHGAFDPEFYENVLDADLCSKHLNHISRNLNLRLKFLDSGLRLPKGIAEGNLVDLGSYHSCLKISEQTEDDVIDGKYCMIKVPLSQNLVLPSFPELPSIPEWPEWLPRPNSTWLEEDDAEAIYNLYEYFDTNRILNTGKRQRNDEGSNSYLSYISITMGMCLPKACTTREALNSLYLNLSSIGFKHEEVFCRLPDDKPWSPADTVAISILSVIGLLTLLSTSYDIYGSIIKKKDPKETNTYLKAFSVYTNTRRLLTFNKVPGAIECIDGIRAFAMAWVILGHTFEVVSSNGHVANLLDVADWMPSAKSLWLMTAPITVDTFFALSGILVVYTTAGKMNGGTLLKNLHLFYLNRLLRLFPILAFVVLLQASIFHRFSDGPDWSSVAHQVNSCRVYWWTNLFYIQTYLNFLHLCLPQTWYLTVDMHLYIISPAILYWVLNGKKGQAWIALIAGLMISLTASTAYIFVEEFSVVGLGGVEESLRYMRDYYINTLTRAPPFFVGMIFGYLLHLSRKTHFVICKTLVTLYWLGAATISALVTYNYYYQFNTSGDNQIIINCINAFIRPLWAFGVGWMVLACANGYGGPINWVLCLNQLKLLSRLSYAMFVIHYPIIFMYIGSALTPFYFDVPAWVYTFLSHFATSFVTGFIATVLVDSPASIFIKLLVKAPKQETPPVKALGNDQENEITHNKGMSKTAF